MRFIALKKFIHSLTFIDHQVKHENIFRQIHIFLTSKSAIFFVTENKQQQYLYGLSGTEYQSLTYSGVYQSCFILLICEYLLYGPPVEPHFAAHETLSLIPAPPPNSPGFADLTLHLTEVVGRELKSSNKNTSVSLTYILNIISILKCV